ncbi:MAG: DUF29 domain-containing protein [Pseudomonadota bacterium]|nr:DUF29 domain-containing protein [Pseudomonadota bacterium]
MSTAADLYERDFYAWAMRNAKLIRQGRLAEVDLSNVAEELESMGRSERRELESRLEVLLMHLLKWRHQPGRWGASWESTIEVQRIDVQEVLDENPSLRPQLPGLLAAAYRKARLKTAGETGLDRQVFPKVCPFSLEQVLDPHFWPEQK